MSTSRKIVARNLAIGLIVALCTGGGIAVATIKAGPTPDPDVNLSAADRNAKYQALQAGYDSRYADWLQSDAANSLDLRSLKREATMAIYPPSAETLEDAVDAADPEGEAEPLLIEGDQAVLLLDIAAPQSQAMVTAESARYGAQSVTPARPVYTIQPYSGQYKVEHGRVRTVKGSKVTHVEGASKNDLFDRIVAHSKANKGKKKLVVDPSRRQWPPDS